MELRSKKLHRSLPRGSIWQMGREGRERRNRRRWQGERLTLKGVGEGMDQVEWGWKGEDGGEVEMLAGGGEAFVLSVQRRTNPKHAADYSRGMKMHNCEGAACSRWRTWEIYRQLCSEHHLHLCTSTRADTHAKKNSHLTWPRKMYWSNGAGDAVCH